LDKWADFRLCPIGLAPEPCEKEGANCNRFAHRLCVSQREEGHDIPKDEYQQEGVDIDDDALPESETEQICPGASVDDGIDIDCGTAQNFEQTDDVENATSNSNVPCGIGANTLSSPSDRLLESSVESPQTKPKSSPTDWHLEPPRVVCGPTDDGNIIMESYSKLNLEEAWDRGAIARSHRPLSSGGRKEYEFLMPTLTCMQCCYPNGSHSIFVGDNRYIESISTTTNWYDGVFVSSFVQLASHYAHTTVNERFSDTEAADMPLVIHMTFPRQQLELAQLKKIPNGVTRVVGVMHQANHYAVLEIALRSKRLLVYDGLNRNLLRWMDHVACALKFCMLIRLDANDYVAEADKPVLIKSGRREQKKIQGYSLSFDYSQQWRLERVEFLEQNDGFSCGPIACVKILEIFNLVTLNAVRLAYENNSLRTMVANEWKRFLERANNDLVVSVKERIPRYKTAAVESRTLCCQVATNLAEDNTC